jgi:hypothetical protein
MLIGTPFPSNGAHLFVAHLNFETKSAKIIDSKLVGNFPDYRDLEIIGDYPNYILFDRASRSLNSRYTRFAVSRLSKIQLDPQNINWSVIEKDRPLYCVHLHESMLFLLCSDGFWRGTKSIWAYNTETAEAERILQLADYVSISNQYLISNVFQRLPIPIQWFNVRLYQVEMRGGIIHLNVFCPISKKWTELNISIPARPDFNWNDTLFNISVDGLVSLVIGRKLYRFPLR